MRPRSSSLAVLFVVAPLATACDSDPQLVQPAPLNEADSGTAGSGAQHDTGNAGASSGSSGTSSGTSGSAGQLSAAGNTSVGGAGGSDTTAAGASGSAGNAGAVNLPPEPVPYTALAVSIAEAHFCVLLDDHNVKCWGSGLYGELGDGSPEGVFPNEPQVIVNLGTGRTAKALSLGFHASCALLDDDSVKCWGYAPQLGIGATEPIGDQASELGDQLPAVDLGPGRTATQLALGHAAGCAILDDGNARCWDLVTHPTFEHEGPAVTQLANGHFPMALFEDGSYGSPESNERELLDGSPALGIAGDSRNVCALLETGVLNCTDTFFLDATLDPETTTSFAIHGAYGSGALCTLDPHGVVRCRGNIEHYDLWVAPGTEPDALTLTKVNLGAKAVQLASGGDRYACAVLEDGRVKCWGDKNRAGNYDAVVGEIQALDLGTH